MLLMDSNLNCNVVTKPSKSAPYSKNVKDLNISDDELDVITFKNKVSDLDSSFNKPNNKIKMKRVRRKNAFTSFESENSLQQSLDETNMSPSSATQLKKNLNSLQKLGLKHEELKFAVIKSRQAFSLHKVSTFFFQDTNFIEEFSGHLLKVEEAVERMGKILGNVLPFDKLESTKLMSKNFLPDTSNEIIYLSDGESGKKINEDLGSLTPPASEVGNYDNTSNLEDSSLTKKRKLSLPVENLDVIKTRNSGNLKTQSSKSCLSPQKQTKKDIPKMLSNIALPQKLKTTTSPRKQSSTTSCVALTQKIDTTASLLKQSSIKSPRQPIDAVSHLKFSSSPQKRRNTDEVVKQKVEDEKLEIISGQQNNNPEEEYEVRKIQDYLKKQGAYYYQVSWKGYESDDDTYEPANNLTGCEEALVLFFYNRFVERHKVSNLDELKKFPLPFDQQVREPLYAAFEKMVYELPESNINSESTKELIKSLFGPKPPVIKNKEELERDLLKLFTYINPAERYSKLYKSLIKGVNLLNVCQIKEKQQAELRSWERNINIICSDPSPLTVENTVDLALPPLEFTYINGYLAGPNLNIPNDPVVGCECIECSSSHKGCCADQMGSYYAYSKYGRLRISLGTPIYECNKLCKCSQDCSNRIVQKGRRIALSIFRTSNGRGWGVKTLEAIKKDTFVTEYVGEVITSEEAERRGTKYDAEGCTYLFDLDYNKGDLNPYTVDAAKYGNVSHFINHSCDPNLVVFNVWVNCLDPDIPRLALFAVCDIKKGEEITFDYNSGSTRQLTASVADSIDQSGLCFPGTPTKILESPRKTPKNNRGLIAGKTECHCGAANCRKYFF